MSIEAAVIVGKDMDVFLPLVCTLGHLEYEDRFWLVH